MTFVTIENEKQRDEFLNFYKQKEDSPLRKFTNFPVYFIPPQGDNPLVGWNDSSNRAVDYITFDEWNQS